MKTTLADRLKEAMQGPPKVTGLALAKACGIKPPSVSDWLSGNTKSMDGVNLIHAAECLRVNPKWLATGLGLKHTLPMGIASIAREGLPDYTTGQALDAWTYEAIAIINNLTEPQREGALAVLRAYAANLGPPRDGQALQMAA